MTRLDLSTLISADLATCFDVARDIDVHMASTAGTNEKAIAGRTSGLCELGDSITWEATHFGIRQKLTSQISKFKAPHFFEDRMLEGAFKSMRHEHLFEEKNGKTVMTDHFEYEVPYGIFGQLFNALVLKSYMYRFLVKRNAHIQSVAEKKQNTIL
jgi:ligand-binding SRPBCC domain-containing protein